MTLDYFSKLETVWSLKMRHCLHGKKKSWILYPRIATSLFWTENARQCNKFVLKRTFLLFYLNRWKLETHSVVVGINKIKFFLWLDLGSKLCKYETLEDKHTRIMEPLSTEIIAFTHKYTLTSLLIIVRAFMTLTMSQKQLGKKYLRKNLTKETGMLDWILNIWS